MKTNVDNKNVVADLFPLTISASLGPASLVLEATAVALPPLAVVAIVGIVVGGIGYGVYRALR
jgi:hypothetical protein